MDFEHSEIEAYNNSTSALKDVNETYADDIYCTNILVKSKDSKYFISDIGI